MWLRRLVSDIRGKSVLDKPLSLLSDNAGAIALTKNEVVNRRNKHIDLAYHFVRDAVRRGIVNITYLPTTEMTADTLTKPLGRILLEKFVRYMGLVSQGE